jgi:virulence factor Mce-like protein
VRAGSRTTRGLAIGGVLLLLVAVLVVATAGSGRPRVVSAMFTSATNVVPGLEVRAAGVRVGKIRDITYEDGQDRFELQISDERIWPLRQGTRATIRFGGTIGYVSRYVELVPGPASAPAIPDGGLIPASRTVTPLDVDQVLRLLDARTRADLRRLLDRGALTVDGLQTRVRQLLRRTPAVTDEAVALLGDLGHDPRTLAQLVRSTDRVVGAAQAAQPNLDALLARADTTFGALAGRTPELQRTLDRLPPALAELRSTFAHADGSLTAVNRLAEQLAPAAVELHRTTPPLNATLAELRTVAPRLRATLATARRASPSLRDLLTEARPLVDDLASISTQAETELNCIRPYSPEIAAFFDGWGGFVKNGDGIDKYFRVLATAPTIPFGTPMTSAEALKLEPWLTYAFPRPPGLNAKKPWFLPECGVGKDVMDPSKDPEAAGNLPAGLRR